MTERVLETNEWLLSQAAMLIQELDEIQQARDIKYNFLKKVVFELARRENLSKEEMPEEEMENLKTDKRVFIDALLSEVEKEMENLKTLYPPLTTEEELKKRFKQAERSK